MDARALAAVVILAGSATVACEPTDPAPRASLVQGDSVPSAWQPLPGGRGGPYVLWLFRTEDCLSCQALDYEFRRVQRRYGAGVPLVAIHVGRDGDAGVARTFLRTRRVNARVVTVAPFEYERSPAPSRLPSVHVVNGRRIVWSAEIFNDSLRLAPRLDSVLHVLGVQHKVVQNR